MVDVFPTFGLLGGLLNGFAVPFEVVGSVLLFFSVGDFLNNFKAQNCYPVDSGCEDYFYY